LALFANAFETSIAIGYDLFALCNKFRPTYVVVRVVAYVYAQLVQQVFVASVSVWFECICVAHNKHLKSRGTYILCALNDEIVT